MIFYYSTPAQDVFDGMVQIDDYIKQPTCDVLQVIYLAMLAAVHCEGWEGDIRGRDFYVFSLPDPEGASRKLGVVWKQDNNGDTFIASPLPLTWLDEYAVPFTTLRSK